MLSQKIACRVSCKALLGSNEEPQEKRVQPYRVNSMRPKVHPPPATRHRWELILPLQ